MIRVQPVFEQATAKLLVRAPAADLPALFDGGPVIVVDSRLPDVVALRGGGARVCRAYFTPEGVMLRLGMPRKEDGDAPALDHPPPAVLALVAQTPLGMQRLAEWWRDRGLEPPVLITAESGLAALPELLAAALAETEAVSRRVCALEQRGAVLRQEAGQLRVAVAAMLNTVAGRPPPAMETRLSQLPDTASPAVRVTAGAEPLLIETGLSTSGVAGVSLHLAGSATVALSVRLIGAETGRVLSAWQVPATALTGGWLQLEVPEPVPGRPETLVLGLRAVGEAGEVALSAASGAPGEPALVVSALPVGARLVQPLHMDWAHWQGDAIAAVPRLAPAQMLAEARLVGPGEFKAGTTLARLLALPEDWVAARIEYGSTPERCAAVRCDLRLEAGAAEARLVLRSDEGQPDDAAAATPWRMLPANETRPFALPIAAGTPDVMIELRGDGASAVVILQPVLFPQAPAEPPVPDTVMSPEPATQRMVQAQPLRALEGAYPRDPWPAAASDDAEDGSRRDGAPHYAEATLDARQNGPGWELLDLRLRGLAFRGERWRELKFKFGVSGASVVLEFRRAPSWPRAFEAWPGTEADAYGDKFVMVLESDAFHGLDRVSEGRDTTLVSALAAAMPRLVAELLTHDSAGSCAGAAGRLAQWHESKT